MLDSEAIAELLNILHALSGDVAVQLPSDLHKRRDKLRPLIEALNQEFERAAIRQRGSEEQDE